MEHTKYELNELTAGKEIEIYDIRTKATIIRTSDTAVLVETENEDKVWVPKFGKNGIVKTSPVEPLVILN